MNNRYELGDTINILEEFSSEELETFFPKSIIKMINKERFPINYKIIKRDENGVELISADNLGVEISFNTENKS